MKTLGDDHLADALQTIGRTAKPPYGAIEQVLAKVRRRRSMGRAVKVAGAAASVALLIPGVSHVTQLAATDRLLPISSTGTPSPTDWRKLTGKELGEALGLTVYPDVPGPDGASCDGGLVEYAEGRAFCVTAAALEAAGVAPTELNRHLIAYQITGLEQSPELIEFIHLRHYLLPELLHAQPFDAERYKEAHDRYRVLLEYLYGPEERDDGEA